MKRRGKREYPIKLIKFNEFEREIDSAGNPVLMLCIRRDYEFVSQTDLIRDVLGSMVHGCPIDLKVCIVDEESRTALNDKLDLQGSPAFLLFDKGKEKGRLLGVADEERLKGFLSNELGMGL
ncbi:hypothetical protein EG833_03900 [archaeon]|nr:hypothetical protein [archaeon]